MHGHQELMIPLCILTTSLCLRTRLAFSDACAVVGVTSGYGTQLANSLHRLPSVVSLGSLLLYT